MRPSIASLRPSGLSEWERLTALNGCKNVLCAVFGFPSQSGELSFALLVLGNVLEAVDRAENVPASILQCFDVNQHNTALAI
jgi:hypothetical protein